MFTPETCVAPMWWPTPQTGCRRPRTLPATWHSAPSSRRSGGRCPLGNNKKKTPLLTVYTRMSAPRWRYIHYEYTRITLHVPVLQDRGQVAAAPLLHQRLQRLLQRRHILLPRGGQLRGRAHHGPPPQKKKKKKGGGNKRSKNVTATQIKKPPPQRTTRPPRDNRRNISRWLCYIIAYDMITYIQKIMLHLDEFVLTIVLHARLKYNIWFPW